MGAGRSIPGGKQRPGHSHSAVRAFSLGLHGTWRTPAHLPQTPTAVPRTTWADFVQLRDFCIVKRKTREEECREKKRSKIKRKRES